MEFQDYYKTLGVPRTATPAEIKKAYRKLARENHPDAKPGDASAETRFKAINEANAVLTDTDKRKRYDTLGKDWERYAASESGAGGGGGGAPDPFGPGSPFAGFGGAAGGGGGRVRYEFRGAEAGGFSDFFRMAFGAEADGALHEARPGGSPSAARRRSIVEATAELSLEEAFHGTKRIVAVDGKRLEVTIPRGVDSGSRIKLTGKGPAGQDLVVVTRVRSHPVFIRRGADLEREVPITLREALLGGEIPVPTLKGRVLLNIPKGTQPGRTFRLTGQGMPRFNASGAGDLYVRVRLVLPRALGGEAQDAATTFLDLVDQPDPRAS